MEGRHHLAGTGCRVRRLFFFFLATGCDKGGVVTEGVSPRHRRGGMGGRAGGLQVLVGQEEQLLLTTLLPGNQAHETTRSCEADGLDTAAGTVLTPPAQGGAVEAACGILPVVPGTR